MWKIICLFSLFVRALSAPSGCIEMCNSLNSQSFQKLSCCGLPMVSFPNDDKNWTEHKDFQTTDGALVHTKDGRFAHGNTHGSYNEMSYYKEFGSGSNHKFGNSFGSNEHSGNSFRINQHSGSNFGVNQKIEDFTSQSSFEAFFESQYSNLMQNLRNSVTHLQELKRKGQLETQKCVYPCIPMSQQINELQQQVNSQEQYIQRMREELWRSQQNQNRLVEHVEQVPHAQVPVQSTYHPGQVVRQVEHKESHHRETITSHPHITTKVSQQPIKYQVQNAQQTLGTGINNQIYHKGSTNLPQSSPGYVHGYESGIQSQAGYDTQTYVPQNPQTRTTYGQTKLNYNSQTYVPQTHGSQIQTSYSQETVQGSPSYQGSKTRGRYRQQNSAYAPQTDGSQDCGPQGCSQGSVTHMSHGSVSQSSISQNYGVGFGSTDGTLTHGVIGMGPITSDCNDESQPQTYSQIRRHKRNSPLRQRLHRSRNESFKNSDLFENQHTSADYSQQSSQQIEDFGEPARIHKVSQQEMNTLRQQVGNIDHGDLQTQDIHQQTQDLTQQNQQLGNDYYQKNRLFDEFSQQTGKLELGQHQNHDHSQHSGKIQFGQNHHQQSSQIESFSQQTQDFSQQQNHGFDQHSGKLEFGQHHHQHPSQIESFSQQQNNGFDQQSGKLEFGQHHHQHPSQIESFSQQQNHGFDQHSGKLEFGQNHHQHPSQIESFSQQQNHGFDQQSGKLEFGQQHQHPSQTESLSQQTQDFSQQENLGFDQHSGKLEFGQQRQHPSQIKPLSQETQGFGTFPKPGKLEDLTQQTQTVIDFSQQPRGFDQQTVGNLKLDQPARDSNDFNQFPTPVLAPDSNQSGNQRLEGLNHQFSLPAKPAPKPTSRPRNPKLMQFKPDKNVEVIFNTDQEIQSSFENLRNTGRGDISAEKEDVPTDLALTPPEVSDTQIGYQQSSEERYHKQDFGQQIQKETVDISQQKSDQQFSQEVQNPFEDLSQQIQKQNTDFSQGIQKTSKDFSQQIHKPFEDFSPQIQNQNRYFSHQVQNQNTDFSQEIQKTSQDFSQQVHRPFEDFSQQIQNQNNNFSQQIQKNMEDFSQQIQNQNRDFSQQVQNQNRDFSEQIQKNFEDFSQQSQSQTQKFSQEIQKPFEDFSQQIQRPREGVSQKQPIEDFSQQVQKPYEDFSQISDLNRNKDITQLPQEPRRGLTQSHQIQNKLTSHISSDISQQTQDILLGTQWHRSHNPGDLTNENIQQGSFPDHIEKMHQIEQIHQKEQIEKEKEKDFIRFDQQSTKKIDRSREFEMIHSADGKLEFGQNVQKRGSDSEINLQPRILEAYGGRGPYDPMHGEDIFSGARLNPSATLPPFTQGDPWDIREKPITPRVIYEDRVIPLDSTWVFPDSLPNVPISETPRPGFWRRVGNRFSGAVDKAKEKARDIFG